MVIRGVQTLATATMSSFSESRIGVTGRLIGKDGWGGPLKRKGDLGTPFFGCVHARRSTTARRTSGYRKGVRKEKKCSEKTGWCGSSWATPDNQELSGGPISEATLSRGAVVASGARRKGGRGHVGSMENIVRGDGSYENRFDALPGLGGSARKEKVRP